jgi:L-iditol 2-dehydrogenase
MKALLLSEYRRLELTDVATPKPQPGEVLLRVAACGICGSDVHGYDGSSGRRIPPIVMGHEAAGIIAGIGEGVRGLSEGDRVTLDSTVYCGSCANCRRGDINLCDRREVLGVSCGDYRRAGAFAEFVSVPSRIVHKLPDSLPFEDAALLEAVAVALHAVSLTAVEPGSTALVVGAGTIGLLLQQALRVAECPRVFVMDPDRTRLNLSQKLGASETIEENVVERINNLTDGTGVDLVVEAVGRTESIATSIDCVRKGGTIILVGNISPEVKIPLQKVVSRQLRLQGSCASAGEYPRAIELMSRGEIRVKPMITAVAPLAEGPQWFERLYAREPNLMKVVLKPGNLS